jgi:hypothetical protein
VEPAAPARPVVRRQDEPHDEESRRRREQHEDGPRDGEDAEQDGLHVDVLA